MYFHSIIEQLDRGQRRTILALEDCETHGGEASQAKSRPELQIKRPCGMPLSQEQFCDRQYIGNSQRHRYTDEPLAARDQLSPWQLAHKCVPKEWRTRIARIPWKYQMLLLTVWGPSALLFDVQLGVDILVEIHPLSNNWFASRAWQNLLAKK